MANAVQSDVSKGKTASRSPQRASPRWTTEVARLFPRQGEWTEAAYLSLPDTNHIVELSDGRLVVPEVPPFSHQYAVGELFALLREFVRRHGLGTPGLAPLRVRLWPGKFREPDIVFLLREHDDRKGEEYWGVPDLAVEVLSPRTEHSSGTERTDRRDKFEEYALAGIVEYWLVDVKARVIEVYVLRGEVYHPLGKWGLGETARSELLPGLEVPVAAVVEEP
jgi:Uma2 family endonuclease